MVITNAKKTVEELLSHADVRINGKRDWDIQVKNPGFYKRVLSGGSLAFGESYMDGWWECKKLDVLFYKLLSIKLDLKMITTKHKVTIAKSKILNMQTYSRAKKVAEVHYDLGNEFYEGMLDKNMLASIKDAEIISISFSKADKTVLEALPKLKLISTRTTGFDNIDLNDLITGTKISV